MTQKEFRLGPTTIVYFIDGCTKKKNPDMFCVEDVLSDLPNYKEACVITDIYTEFASRNQGYAKAAVKRFIELVSPTMPVLAKSMVLFVECPVEPTEEMCDEIITKKNEFLEKVGFTNINKYVGYEDQEVFLYVNEKTQPYIDACEAREKEFKKEKNNGI